MTDTRNQTEPDAFALKIIEIQYNTIRSEIEYYLGKIYDVLRLSLATVPLLAGALIALVADQGTWSMATQRPILLGLFCLLSPMFLVICVYLGNIGIAHYKAVTRAADYIKVHFEDYLFQPIMDQLSIEKEQHIFRSASFEKFLFWENYLSQHGVPEGDTRVRSDYDSDKHMMFAFLVFLGMALTVISVICSGAFFALIWNASLWTSGAAAGIETLIFEGIVAFSALLFAASLIWTVRSFSKFFAVLRTTGALQASIDGGLKTD